MTHHSSSFFPPIFILAFSPPSFIPFSLFPFSSRFLSFTPYLLPFPFYSFSPFCFLPLFSLSLAKHALYIHAFPSSLRGFGEHRDKYVIEACFFTSSSYYSLRDLFVNERLQFNEIYTAAEGFTKSPGAQERKK